MTIRISRQRLAILDRVLVGVIGIARRRYTVTIVRESQMRTMKSMKRPVNVATGLYTRRSADNARVVDALVPACSLVVWAGC